MKKLIFLFLSLFFIDNAYAVQVNGSNYSMPPSALFYANYSLSSSNAMNTYNYNDSYFYASMGYIGGNNTVDPYGMSMCFGIDNAFVKDYLYSISVVVQNDQVSDMTVASTGNYDLLRVGYSLSDAITHSGSTEIYYFGASQNVTVAGTVGSILVYLFIPNINSNYVCLPMKSTVNYATNTYRLFGYQLTPLGSTTGLTSSDISSIIASSGLASSSDLNSLSSNLANVEQNITNNLNNTRASINNTITNSTNQIDNTITNITVDSPANDISSFSSFLASNSTISNLLTLPITLFQKVLNSLNSSCTSYDLGELLGTHIVLPCIVTSDYIGATLWNVIDVLISGMFVYHISRKFIKVFDNMSSMKDGDVIND